MTSRRTCQRVPQRVTLGIWLEPQGRRRQCLEDRWRVVGDRRIRIAGSDPAEPDPFVEVAGVDPALQFVHGNDVGRGFEKFVAGRTEFEVRHRGQEIRVTSLALPAPGCRCVQSLERFNRLAG